MRRTINTSELAAQLRIKRFNEGLSISRAAHAAGVSQPTLSRVLRGNHVPYSETLVRLAQWLDISLEQLIDSQDEDQHMQEDQNLTGQNRGASTPEAVAYVLHADTALKPEDVETLMVAFRVMYDRLRTQNEKQAGNERAVPPLDS